MFNVINKGFTITQICSKLTKKKRQTSVTSQIDFEQISDYLTLNNILLRHLSTPRLKESKRFFGEIFLIHLIT